MMSGAVDPARAPDDLVWRLVATTTDFAVATLDPSGTITSWNAGAALLHGFPASDMIGADHSRLYPPGDVDAGVPAAELAAAAATGRHEVDGVRLRRDGTGAVGEFRASVAITALRSDAGEIAGYGIVARDLASAGRPDEALRESEERFRLLVTNVVDYAIFLLDPDGNVASWNVGAERMKGYRADEILGHHISDFYTGVEREAGLPWAALAEARSAGRWQAEGWRVRKDGSRFWASVVITSLVTPDGQQRGFAKITRDLTERKREEELRSELLSIIAHDLRAPAGVIQHLVYGLRQDWGEATDADKLAAIDRIETRTGRMASLADDLFDVSQIDAGHLEVTCQPVDVGPIVEQIAADGAQASHREVTARIDDGVVALGDERRIWQIVTNLVSNALKFSPPTTGVELRARRIGDEVVVAVSDRGPGIPADEVPRLFDRFSRLSRTADVPGTGIGLFIARSLAEAQGGRLDVETAEGVGSTFSLVLPAAERAA